MRLIDADAAIDAVLELNVEHRVSWVDAVIDMLDEMPTEQLKKGRWEEPALENVKAAGVEEVQSARCSACGLYHTTPYLYHFKYYNFCPHCGADMRKDTQ